MVKHSIERQILREIELPDDIKSDIAMMAGCIAGAEYVENIKIMLRNASFKDINMKPKDNSREIIKSWVPDKNAEDFIVSEIFYSSFCEYHS